MDDNRTVARIIRRIAREPGRVVPISSLLNPGEAEGLDYRRIGEAVDSLVSLGYLERHTASDSVMLTASGWNYAG